MQNGFWPFIFISLYLLASGCSQKNEAPSTPCKFTVQQHQDPKFSTDPNTFHIPHNQKALVDMMWVSTADCECYAKQFGPVHVYKVPYNDGLHKSFVAPFPPVTEAAYKTWHEFENTSDSTLRGLTTFRFENKTDEKILNANIMLREDSGPWHLWHEFSHFIIGVNRASSHTDNLLIAQETTVESLRQKMLEFDPIEDRYLATMQDFFNTYNEYLLKRYLDEIVIEASLIHLTSQRETTPQVTVNDFTESLRVIEFFYYKLIFSLMSTQNQTYQLLTKANLTNAEKNFLNKQIEHLILTRNDIENTVNNARATVKDIQINGL